MLGYGSAQVQTPALRAVGNVATGTAQQTRAVLECDVLPQALGLLHSQKKEIRKEACWMVSNLTAGASEQIDAVCAAGLMPRLVEMSASEEFEIRKEATYAICNACLGGSPTVVSLLLELRVLPPLLDLLDCPDAGLILTVRPPKTHSTDCVDAPAPPLLSPMHASPSPPQPPGRCSACPPPVARVLPSRRVPTLTRRVALPMVAAHPHPPIPPYFGR